MLRKLMVAAGTLAIFTAILLAQEGSKTKQKQPAPADAKVEAKPDAVREAVDKLVQSYVEAFNKNDADAVAAHWSEKGVYVDRETGERSEGREHLLNDFRQLFSEHGGAQLTIDVTRTRLVRPDVAAVEGTATAMIPDAETIATDFSALLVKQQDKWLIESVNESPLAGPTSAQEALQELAWMIGHWVDESDSVHVDTNCRWGADGTFLVRSFVVQPADEELMQGTQVIAWDPRLEQIRSWKFFSDGSFGEAVWSKSGDDWLIKGTHTLSDGRLASGTQVIQRVDENTLLVQLIGRDIDGVPVPSTEPVKVVRAADSEEHEAEAPAQPREAEPARDKAATDAPPRGKSEGGRP